MGDKLGWVDRTEDLERSVGRIAALLEDERVDILIVAGDLLSEVVRPQQLSRVVAFWSRTFATFLGRGGTVVAVTGNHDHEIQCEIVRGAMDLAAPPSEAEDAASPRGRFYLATRPTLMRLAGSDNQPGCQFALLPYPTPTAYFDGPVPAYSSQEERARILGEAFYDKLAAIKHSPAFRIDLPSILVGHVHVDGAGTPRHLFRISDDQDVVLDPARIWDGFDYVALGHIHKPQAVAGNDWFRYSGSPERLDLGEADDEKSVVIFDMDGKRKVGEPRIIPVEATPVVLLEFDATAGQTVEDWVAEHQHRATSLVKVSIVHDSSVHNTEEIFAAVGKAFPRLYGRNAQDSTRLEAPFSQDAEAETTFGESVRGYVNSELLIHPNEAERQLILARLEHLLNGEQA